MRSAPLALALSFTALSPSARAQESPDERSRRALLDAAYELADRGDHARAIDLAETAGRVRMTPSLRLFLAEEHARSSRGAGAADHLLDAVAHASRCVVEAAAQPSLPNRERIVGGCNAVLAQLAPRTGFVRVVVAAEPGDGTRVTLNGRDLPPEWWNAPVPSPAGETPVVIERPGFATSRWVAHVEVGAVSEVAVTMVRRAAVGAAPPVVATPAPERIGPWLRTGSWAAMGVGAVATLIGVVQWGRSAAQRAEAVAGEGSDGGAWARYANRLRVDAGGTIGVETVCATAAAETNLRADADAARRLCEANRSATAMAWGFGASGLLLIGAGVTGWLLTRHRVSNASASVSVAAGFVGANLAVRF